MSDDLTLQEPGASPDLDTARLDAILASSARDITGQLAGLSEPELTYLHTAEFSAKKPRTAVLKAIGVVMATIEAEGSVDSLGEIEGASEANLGNRVDHASMHAADIDRAALLVPVLTLDGWVLPLNRAEGV